MTDPVLSNRNITRAFVSLAGGLALLLLTIGFGFAGFDRVAGWLSVLMWVALIRAMWFGTEARHD